MNRYLGPRRAAALAMLAALASAPLCFAVDTRVWEQTEEADFARGTAKHLSIRSDGRLTLAPEFKELDSTGVPYLWSLAQDSKGTVYYAGGAPTGATAKVFALAPGGKPRVVAELSGLEVHALAVDRQDRVYAAVQPDAKIYRIDASGKAQLFFDPKCKYVWALAFDKAGNLFAATGDTGLIYKISPDGKGEKFLDTQETHARSMAIDGDGNLIVGTEPGGLVLRVTPEGKSFVLYQANKREVTAVAERGGIIYAAAIGSRPGSASVSGNPPVLPATSPSAPVTSTGAPRPGNTPPSLPPVVGNLSASISGGSEIYRIQKDGFAERIWNSATNLAYAIAFDAAGKPLVATGNKGIIYRVDSDELSTQLLNAPPTQITALLQGQHDIVYAATGNVGTLYSIGPSTEKSGTLESEVLDAGDFAYWGKAHITAAKRPGTITLETRSGNLNNPANSWSAWSKVALSETGGPILSPAARFLQYRLTLGGESGGGSPEVSAIDIPYLPKNIAPRVQQIALAPFNYRQPPASATLERTVNASGSPATITLPAVGQRRSPAATLPLDTSGSATLQYSKGFVTVRWNASDANGDPLLYRVEIRPAAPNGKWQVLKDKLQERYYAFDSTAFPDGQYVVRVTASDLPGNTVANALQESLESDPFIVDNTPPGIADSRVAANASGSTLKFTARDALSWIDKAEYSVNGGEWILLEPDNRVTDSQVLSFTVNAKPTDVVTVRVFDEDDNVVVRRFVMDQDQASR
jgi:hypothetical protein